MKTRTYLKQQLATALASTLILGGVTLVGCLSPSLPTGSLNVQPAIPESISASGAADVSPVVAAAVAQGQAVPFRTDESPFLNYEPSASNSQMINEVNDPEGEFDSEAQSNGDGKGSFNLAVTDAPLENGVSQIRITFSKIEITNKQTGVVYAIASSPVTVNLLDLQNGLSQVFNSVQLPAGHYNNLRFYIGDVVVIKDGVEIQVFVHQFYRANGIKIFGSFHIKEGQSAEVLLDFDARRCLVFGGKGKIFFRPTIYLRSLRFNPSGIHFVQAPNGTMSLVGPKKTVKPHALLHLKDPSGNSITKLAKNDGSFEFKNIDRVFGQFELSIVEWWFFFFKFKATIKLSLDFSMDDKYPAIMASHLDKLFKESYENVGKNSSAFISLFSSDAFRYLAGRYLQVLGKSLPSGFVFPELPVPYAFELAGPEYQLPGYALSGNAAGFYVGGGSSAGCSDARKVFEGNSIYNNHLSLDVNGSLAKMVEQKLPFTGLLAEYQHACRSRDLAELSCSNLASFAHAGASSLPSESLLHLKDLLNSPRGGLVSKLLACVNDVAPNLGSVTVPDFSNAGFACTYGCGDQALGHYLGDSDLLSQSQLDGIISNPVNITDLDSFATLALQNSVSPLALAASYVAYHSDSKVHGYRDLNQPAIFNVSPAQNSVHDGPSVLVSASSLDRSVVDFRINGSSVPFSMAADGSVSISQDVSIGSGSNSIQIQAEDSEGNVAQYELVVMGPAPEPTPSPTPSESPSPEPTPTPSESPSPEPTPTPSESPSPEPTPTPSESPSPEPSPTPTLVAGVDAMCQVGSFVPKASINIGISTDNSTVVTNLTSNLTSRGLPFTFYSAAEIESGQPVVDGKTVLILARKTIGAPVSQAYVDGVKAYIASGGSVLGEYDAGAFFFTNFALDPNIAIIPPAPSLFSGDITGGGILLPISFSTTFVTDSSDPLMQGLPASMSTGVRSAFAVTNYNNNWLHQSASFVTDGNAGLMAPGTYPAVLSGRCGEGRMALYMMNYFNSTSNANVNIMFGNTLNWLVGN
jgi:hypothetical protein